MQKFIFYSLVGLIILILALRFIEVDNPYAKQIAKTSSVPCADNGDSEPNIFSCDALAFISDHYKKNIKPIFEQKCSMCHGQVQKVPLYSKIPPISMLIQHDIEEARHDFNTSYDFPFIAPKDQLHALEEIAEVIEADTMPPLIYKIMHWQSSLTQEEKSLVLDWIKQAETKLKGE